MRVGVRTGKDIGWTKMCLAVAVPDMKSGQDLRVHIAAPPRHPRQGQVHRLSVLW